MKFYWFNVSFLLIGIFGNFSNINSATAQIITDTTLGNESSSINSNDLIEGGAIRQNNLFHSFREFNVNVGQNVYFANPAGITNIFTRVTGNNASNILGNLGVDGEANLFLINPNGIFFGPNASLDINGSFLATTADSMIFDDSTKFSATNAEQKPLLTVKVPIGLGFGDMPGSITNQSLGGLIVQPGKTLALVGGNVVLEQTALITEGGRIEIGSVAGNSQVDLEIINESLILNYNNIDNFQDINLFGSLVNINGARGGDIQIQGKNVILESSQVTSFSLSETEVQAGNVVVNASDSLELNGIIETSDGVLPTGLFAEVYGQATGRGSSLTIATKKLILRDGATISTTTYGAGQGLDLTVNATESVEVIGTAPQGEFPSGLFATVAVDVNNPENITTGAGGTLTIETGRLTVKDGAIVSTDTSSVGRAGDLQVNATDSIELIGTAPDGISPSGLIAQVAEGATGNGGNLTINTQRLSAKDGAQLSSSARTGGQGGNITISASDSIQLSGTAPLADLVFGSSGIFVEAEPDSIGRAGDLNITTGQLIVENGATISATTLGTGKGGSANLNVARLIIQDGGQVEAGSLLGEDPINFERGDGGTLTVNASESIKVNGSGEIGSIPVKSSLFTQAQGTGNAGDLNIFTPNLTVRDGGEINVSATGSGEAGNLQVEADSIHLDRGTLTATTVSGEGGDIKLQVDDLLFLENNSLISAEASKTANGGNIDIDAGFVIAVPNENSDIIANASKGRGGNINITTQGIFNIEEREAVDGNSTNDIDASSEFGLAGTVTINSPDVDPSRKLVRLPNVPVTVEVAQGCQAEGKQASVEFFNTGKGGLAPSPYEPLSSSNIWEDIPPPTQETANTTNEKSTSTSPDKIIEAQGWQINEKGEVTLVAEVPKTHSQSRCRLQ